MKLTKSKLKQLIKEELNKVLKEQSLQQQIGLPHGKFTPGELITALENVVKNPEALANINMDELVKMVSNKIHKEGTSEEKNILKSLRDDMLRAAEKTGRDGLTSYERSREKRGYKIEREKEAGAHAAAAKHDQRQRDLRTGGY
jgi:hypothetical protein